MRFKTTPSEAVPLLLVTCCLGLLTGCTETATPTQPTTGAATVSIQASSTSVTSLSSIRVTISSITLVAASGGADVALSSSSQTVDLVPIQTVPSEIVHGSADPGDYVSLRVEFDQSTSEVVESSGGSPLPLTITSPTSILPLSLHLSAGDTVTLNLSFETAGTLRQTTSGDWVYTPVLQVSSS